MLKVWAIKEDYDQEVVASELFVLIYRDREEEGRADTVYVQ